MDFLMIRNMFEDPTSWDDRRAKEIFARRKREAGSAFRLGANQFFPMGDNSPASLDARVWGGPPHVEGDMLIGRALFVYWPHSKNKPIPYFPNFERMKFIR
jgi:signal peptidase I